MRDDAPRLARHAQRWLALNSLPGYRTQEDPTSQSLALWLNPVVFETTRLSSDAAATPDPSPVEPALFLNLEVNYTRIQARHTGSPQDLSAFSEIGWSSAAGVLTSTVIGRQALGGNGGQSGMPDWVRLETTFTRQGLEGEPTLRLGDSVTRTGLTGRSVYFGGLQWGTDNDAATGVGRGPRSVIGGTAATPGTVELFVNDVLRQTARVPSGPFAIDVPPLLGSDGQVRVVVRDLMGRETVIAQPIFQVANQLEEGSRDWNVAVGAVRQRLGLRSNDYGERFAAGLLRMGLNKTLTTEWQGHWSEQSKSLGMGISWALPEQRAEQPKPHTVWLERRHRLAHHPPLGPGVQLQPQQRQKSPDGPAGSPGPLHAAYHCAIRPIFLSGVALRTRGRQPRCAIGGASQRRRRKHRRHGVL